MTTARQPVTATGGRAAACALGPGGAGVRADRAARGRPGAQGQLGADAGAPGLATPRWTRCGSRWRRRRSRPRCASCSAGRWPRCWPAAPARPAGPALGGAAAAGAAAGGRRARAAVPARAATGCSGAALDLWFGITVPFTTAAVVLAQTFVALPFLVVSLEGALRTAGQRYEAVAATLGASPTLAFRRVTVPLVLPGPGVGHGARVRPLPRRVRRDHRVRGQPAGHHPHPAAAGLPGARDRRGRGRRAVAAAGRRGRRGDRGGPPARLRGAVG